MRNLRMDMTNMPFEPTMVSHGGVPMETAPLIEDVFDKRVADALYESERLREIFDEKGIEIIEFGGGEFGITINMLLDIQVKELSQVVLDQKTGKKMGIRRAANLKSKADSLMKVEPYY